MVKKTFVVGMLTILLAFGMILVGCDKDGDSSDSGQGTLTFYNDSGDSTTIARVEIYNSRDYDKPVINYTAPIRDGADHSWKLDVGEYYIGVRTSTDGYLETPLFSIKKGETKNVTFNGGERLIY
jgi:hypothetical protein